eukprot:12059144-Karenia_brevis.AAC.1
MCDGESKSVPEDDPCASMGDTESKSGLKYDAFAQMCHPQDESQMAHDMAWGPDSSLTAEEASQMYADLSWPVEDDTPMVPEPPRSKEMCDQGFASNKAA